MNKKTIIGIGVFVILVGLIIVIKSGVFNSDANSADIVLSPFSYIIEHLFGKSILNC